MECIGNHILDFISGLVGLEIGRIARTIKENKPQNNIQIREEVTTILA